MTTVERAGAAWIDRAFATAARWFREAPPELESRLAKAHARVSSAQGRASIAGALTAPFATPFIPLIEAFRSDLRLPAEGVVDAVAEGTLALYFYLRIQDDIVDEPAIFDASHVYAAELFAGESAAAFARAAGDWPAFWVFRRDVLRELSAVSVWELDVYRASDPVSASARVEEDAVRLGRKLAPVAIPLAALATAAGQERALRWIRLFAEDLGCALQIANDLLNARDDHVARRLSPSLAALYASGRVTAQTEAFRIWPALASDAALARMQGIAAARARSAITLAEEAGAPELARAASESMALLEEIPARLLKLSLGVRP